VADHREKAVKVSTGASVALGRVTDG